MMPEKWTPPKLRARPFINPSAWAILTDETPPVKVCELSDFASHSKNYADLFAAAPELYALLEQVLVDIENAVGDCGGYPTDPKPIRAALAKARGETPDAR